MQDTINKMLTRLILNIKEAITNFPIKFVLNVQLQSTTRPQPRLILIHPNNPRYILPPSKILTQPHSIHLLPKLYLKITNQRNIIITNIIRENIYSLTIYVKYDWEC